MNDDAHRARAGTTAARLAVVAALLAIGAATLTPQQTATRLPPWWRPFSGAGDGADALLNVCLFVPLGLALGLARVPRRRSMIVALATTVTVEVLQAFVIPGRQASIGDVITNTMGGWLGHALTGPSVAAWRAEARFAGRLAAGYAAAWLGGTLLTAALLRPALPAERAYASRCGGDDLPDCFAGWLASPVRLRQPGRPDVAITSGVVGPVGAEAAIVATLVDGGRSVRPGRVGGIVTRDGGPPILTLEQGDHWLVFVARTRGAAWGARTPAVAMPHVLGRPGARVTATGGVTGNLRWLEVGGRRVELALSGADGWRLLYPWSAHVEAILRVVGALFHAIVLLPIGFWMTRARGEAAGVLATVGLAALAFVGGGLSLGLAPARATDWAGVVVGAAAGALLARRARR